MFTTLLQLIRYSIFPYLPTRSSPRYLDRAKFSHQHRTHPPELGNICLTQLKFAICILDRRVNKRVNKSNREWVYLLSRDLRNKAGKYFWLFALDATQVAKSTNGCLLLQLEPRIKITPRGSTQPRPVRLSEQLLPVSSHGASQAQRACDFCVNFKFK